MGNRCLSYGIITPMHTLFKSLSLSNKRILARQCLSRTSSKSTLITGYSISSGKTVTSANPNTGYITYNMRQYIYTLSVSSYTTASGIPPSSTYDKRLVTTLSTVAESKEETSSKKETFHKYVQQASNWGTFNMPGVGATFV